MERRDGWSSPARAERPGGNRIRLTGRLVHVYFFGWGGGTADASVRRIVRVFRGLWSLRLRRIRQFLRVLCVSDFLPVARGHLPCACSRTGAAADFFGFPAAGSATNPAVKSHQPQRSGFALILKAGAGKTPGLLPAPAFKINANPVACYACDLTAENRDRLCGVGGYPRPSGRFHRLRRGFRWGTRTGERNTGLTACCRAPTGGRRVVATERVTTVNRCAGGSRNPVSGSGTRPATVRRPERTNR